MFLVLTTYAKPVEEIEKFLPAHSAHLDNYYRTKKIIFSGRKNPRTGGIMLFNVDSKEELLSIIEKDPFKLNGCANYEITEFIPTKYDEDFACFVIGSAE